MFWFSHIIVQQYGWVGGWMGGWIGWIGWMDGWMDDVITKMY